MTGGESWAVDLTEPARTDFATIVSWTEEQFGNAQARVYADTMRLALFALASGPETPGVKRRAEIGKDIGSLHVARARRRGRHVILFRVRGNEHPRVIEVLRILHDAMDLVRHVP